jgi:hypothetical protein
MQCKEAKKLILQSKDGKNFDKNQGKSTLDWINKFLAFI